VALKETGTLNSRTNLPFKLPSQLDFGLHPESAAALARALLALILGGALPHAVRGSTQVRRRAIMKARTLWIAAAIATGALAGCYRAEPPGTAQRDLAQARDAAAEKEAKADQKQAAALAAASQEMATQSQKAEAKSADAAYDVAVTKADGDYDIAVAKCERLSGDAQKACMDEASASRDMEKAKAKAAKVDHT
jgi:hypothetical protein